MKIKVKDLEFNPFRNINLVPIDSTTVEKLKESIEDLGLWAGMTARPHPTIKGKYQIPFGHHRLVAIKELEIEEIDISIQEISDFNMVLMMVQENMTQRGVSVEMINGTVREVKDFLDGEIAKYKNWTEAQGSDLLKSIGQDWSDRDFTKRKNEGVGENLISRFLKGSIPQWRIAEALDIIKNKDIDIDAINEMGTTGRAQSFKSAIRKINKEKIKNGEKPIPKEKHKELANKINNKENLCNGQSRGQGDYQKSMENIIRQEIDNTDEFETKLNEIKFDIDGINIDTKRLANKIGIFNGKLNEMGVTEIKSLSTLFVINELSNLLVNIGVLADYFGIKLNK